MKKKLTGKVLWVILALPIIYTTEGCSIFSDRTTSVYGTVTDEDGLPVDSILVSVIGVKINGFQNMASALTNSNGRYEILVEVSGKFTKVECLITSNSLENPKFQRSYSGYDIFKDGKKSSFSIEKGEKNNTDFKLKSK